LSKKNKQPARRVLELIQSERWLITEDGLSNIIEIASRENLLTPEMISSFSSQRSGREGMVKMYDDTAVLSIQGPVFRYANLFTVFSGATSTESVSAELGRVERDEKVKRVIAVFDTPGGMANGAAEQSSQFQNFSKPLITFASGMCASLGYFWGAQGDQMVVAEDAIVGNIGTRTQAPPARSESDIVSRNAPNKLLSRNAVQGVADDLEQVFIRHVAMGRGVDSDYVVEHFGQGGVFIGEHAVEAGLADSIGTLDSILGGDFPVKSSARKRVIQSSSIIGETMSKEDTQNAGGISAAEHTKAVADAKAEGIREGEANKAQAVTDAKAEATTAERDRASGIVSEGKGKPYDFMAKLVANGATLEDAKDYLGDLKPESTLSSQMNGTNPDIKNDNGADDNGETDQEGIDASWSAASKKVGAK